MKNKAFSAIMLASVIALSGCTDGGNSAADKTSGEATTQQAQTGATEDPGKAIRDSVLEQLGRKPSSTETPAEAPEAEDDAKFSFEEVAIPGTEVQSDGEYLYIMSTTQKKLVAYPKDGGAGRLLYETEGSNDNFAFNVVDGKVYLVERLYAEDVLNVCLIDAKSGDVTELISLPEEYFFEIYVDKSAGDHGMLNLGYRTAPPEHEKYRVYSLKADGTIDREESSSLSASANEADMSEISPYDIIGRHGDDIVYRKYILNDSGRSEGTGFYLFSPGTGATSTIVIIPDDGDDTADDFGMPVPTKDGLLFPFSNDTMMLAGMAFAPYDGGGLTEFFRKPAGNSIYNYDVLETAEVYGIIGDTLYYLLPDDDHLMQAYAYDLTTEEETLLPGGFFEDEKIKALGLEFHQDYREHYFRNDPEMQLLTRNTVSYPQLSGNSDAIKRINEMFREKGEDALSMDSDEAQDEWYLELLYDFNGVTEEDIPNLDPIEYKSYTFLNTYEYSFSGVPYLSDSICTISMSDYIYAGGAHGMQAFSYHNFDLATGEELELFDVIEMSEDDFNEILVKCMTQAVLDGDIYLYDDYGTKEEIMAKCMEYAEEYGPDHIFSLSDYGIRIDFPAYSIGPYASGQQSVLIPYDMIKVKRK